MEDKYPRVIMHGCKNSTEASLSYTAVLKAIKGEIKEGRYNFHHYRAGDVGVNVCKNKNSYTTYMARDSDG